MLPATLALAGIGSLAAGIVLQLLVAGFASSRAKGVLAVLCSALALFAVLCLAPAVRGGGAVDIALARWDGPFDLVLHVDALSVLFAAMAAGIGGAVLVFSVGYMAGDPACTRFYALMLAFIGGLLGLVFSANLFLVYACWEVVGLCSFGLVGFWTTNPEAVKGARKVLLMTHLAGYGLLAAIIALHVRTGTALWTDPAIAGGFGTGVFLLMLVSLAAKSVQFPLHTWIPEAMAAPTPVSALLHAACYVKAGVYLAARMHSLGPWHASWSATMVAMGTVTMIVGATYAIIQDDLKRMLAFSTVSQIGYMITGLGIGTPLGITAALLHCLNHGFFKGGLFLAAGSVQHATGTRDMNRLGGLSTRMPRTTVAWLVQAGSMMGVPLMSGFASKWMLYSAALQAGLIVPALAAWLASIATVFYCAKATSAVFLGPSGEKCEEAHESPPSLQWGLGLLAVGTLVLSVAPQLPVKLLVTPALAALGLPAGVEVTWFGLAGPASAWWTTTGFVLAVISVALGAVVYLLARPLQAAAAGGPAGAGAAGAGVFTGGEPIPENGRLSAADFSEILRQHWAPLYRWSDVDRVYRASWEALRGISAGASRLLRRAEGRALAWTAGLAFVLLAATGLLLKVTAPASEAALPPVPPLLLASCAVASMVLALAAVSTPAARRSVPPMLLAGAAAVAGLAARAPLVRLGLLEGAAMVALVLIWRAVPNGAARSTYLAVVVLSAAALSAGELSLEAGAAGWARALFLTGFLLKLGLVPLFLWLPRIAEDVPALLLGLVVAVVDLAAFGELWALAQAAPWLLEPRGLWLGVALASALLGALLMLGQRDLKRLLVLSTIEDLGFLLLGLVAGGALGVSGALWGAAAHGLAKALLFASLGAPEAEARLSPNAAGLAASYPVSGAGFLVGMLAVLGVPPTLGFAGRWRLFEAAAGISPGVLAAFAIASGMAVIAYALALTRAWWGPAAPDAPAGREPALLRATVALLCALLVVAGAWPGTLALLTGGSP
ncbi:MAG TPA: proton-conducting transporter membrane subunit [Anaeromyxobacter sp.]|nr:proton-conducting transporter membrane subunit [Anaeromyxobacter sp.]